MTSGTVSLQEVEKFDALGSVWWDSAGPMRPLHQMNPARIGWVNGLLAGPTRILDVGCGAGLAAEALARRGHDVLGIDPAGEAIGAAEAHAEGQGLSVQYRACRPEELLHEGERFPVITALEVIEHVPSPLEFVRVLAGLLEPGGLMVFSTLNRTRRSWLTAKVGAEYVLRLLPRGTHDWRAFLTPAELARVLRIAGLGVEKTTGLLFDPIGGRWRTGRDMSVNYMVAAR